MKEGLLSYESPLVRVAYVQVEKGFASSQDYEEDGNSPMWDEGFYI
ncbi:MAG: hypothetical protein IKY70_00635 [Bacteroidales bacterium]|nr:hypothetical protein [Bacteroidales bacterium]